MSWCPVLRAGSRRPHLLLVARRAVSTSSTPPTKHTFIVYAPDKTDEGTLERRLSVRPSHLVGVSGMRERGLVKFGGAMLTPESVAGPKKMVGSVMFYEAASLDEVRAAVEGDIYYTSGVWDPERIVIQPFAAAMPWPGN
ncbi:hypothetical protein BV25DRAFT_1807433 [Artomyces pyxidatus]|uniref:Uncharacterized protein n=1 Tax=Artomyces pyxidatus TaxID=48021 RepID=A0ACB8SVB5_9AGAM|nr:hypothetical protein BV25DRAFT_1807433 [Artomyces pyxidatus]